MKNALGVILTVAALFLIFAAGFWAGREYTQQEENDRRIAESAAEIYKNLEKTVEDLKRERESIKSLSGGVEIDKPASPPY